MNMPGFTAETSLYQTNNHYRFAAAGNFLSNGNTTVTPQGCGLFELAACGFQIGICIPIVAVSCNSDPGSCLLAWALCMGSSMLLCKDCIDNIIHGGGGEGGGGGPGGGGVGGGGTGGPCGCARGKYCCGTCSKTPGRGTLECDGQCIRLGEECTR
jgi:hypothetical protein